MRILIISFRFPPYNSIGAVRVGKTAKYLASFGHDVRVISAKDQPLRDDLSLEIEPDRVTYTEWLNVNRPAELISGGREQVQQKGFNRNSRFGLLRHAGGLYKSVANVPDGQIGWLPFATRAARGTIDRWRPDVIFASGAPFTSLVVAQRVASRYGIPWVAELRDLWVDGGYGSSTPWRIRLDRWFERRTLTSASGLVTVSAPLAEVLERKFGKPTEVILNGFDPDDLPSSRSLPTEGPLRIVYTGIIYEGRRDPTPLFQALRLLGPTAQNVRVAFYGRYMEPVRRLAFENEVEELVEVHEAVSYRDALRIQSEADALLLLMWNDESERGVYTGKFFEYLAAGRPILVLGPANNVAAEVVRDRNAGVVALDPAQIASAIESWLNARERNGGIPGPPPEVRAGFSREEQARKLEQFLVRTVRSQG